MCYASVLCITVAMDPWHKRHLELGIKSLCHKLKKSSSSSDAAAQNPWLCQQELNSHKTLFAAISNKIDKFTLPRLSCVNYTFFSQYDMQ